MRFSRISLALLAFAALATACGNEHELLRMGGEASGQTHGDPPFPQAPADDEDEPGDDTGDADEPDVGELPDRDDERESPDGNGAGADCTFTQGFWKNHEEAWPVSSLTIGGASYSAAQLDALFGTPTNGDASLILGHQLIAALLNIANGAATPPEVDTAVDSAQQWMAVNADADGRLPYGTTSGGDAHSQATLLSDTLADFNEGSIGPGHCR